MKCCGVLGSPKEKERIAKFSDLLRRLPEPHYQSLRHLLGHLVRCIFFIN